jgi:UrcA family protein
MNTNAPILRVVMPFICIAAVAACTDLSGPQTRNQEVTIRSPVSTADLNLSGAAGARKLYGRLQAAARDICGDRPGLQPVDDFGSCYEKALGDAIRSVNLSQLTTVYLRTHTIGDAQTHCVDVTSRLAAK